MSIVRSKDDRASRRRRSEVQPPRNPRAQRYDLVAVLPQVLKLRPERTGPDGHRVGDNGTETVVNENRRSHLGRPGPTDGCRVRKGCPVSASIWRQRTQQEAYDSGQARDAGISAFEHLSRTEARARRIPRRCPVRTHSKVLGAVDFTRTRERFPTRRRGRAESLLRPSLQCLACGARTQGWTIDVNPVYRWPRRQIGSQTVHRLDRASPNISSRQYESESRGEHFTAA